MLATPVILLGSGQAGIPAVRHLGTAVTVLLTSAVWSGLAEAEHRSGRQWREPSCAPLWVPETAPQQLKNSFVLFLTGSHCTALTDLVLIR